MTTLRSWGLGGLIAFEALISAVTFARGLLDFTLISVTSAVLLALVLTMGPKRWIFVALAAATFLRGWLQTASGTAPLGIYPTYLVPLGFLLAGIAPAPWSRAGIVGIAIARSWFVLFYLPTGTAVTVVANVLGAAGAWLWLAGEIREPSATLNDAPRVAPP